MQNPLKGNSLFATLGAPHDNITLLFGLYIAFLFHISNLFNVYILFLFSYQQFDMA